MAKKKGIEAAAPGGHHHLPAVDYGECVRRAREAAGLSLQDLADRSGLHKMSIAKIEWGTHSPSAAHLHKIAYALNKSLDELVGVWKPPAV